MSPNSDGSIEKIQIAEGEGYTTPNEGAIVNGKLLSYPLISSINLWKRDLV